MDLEKLKKEESKWKSNLQTFCERKASGLTHEWRKSTMLDIDTDITHATRKLKYIQEQIEKLTT